MSGIFQHHCHSVIKCLESFYMGNFVNVYTPFAFPQFVCLSVVCWSQWFSCPTICFQSDFCWSRINDKPHYSLQPSSAADASVFTSVWDQKSPFCFEVLWQFCLKFRHHPHNPAISMPSLSALNSSATCHMHWHCSPHHQPLSMMQHYKGLEENMSPHILWPESLYCKPWCWNIKKYKILLILCRKTLIGEHFIK